MGFLAFDRASLFFHFVSDIRWEERSLEAWQDGIKLRSCPGGQAFSQGKPQPALPRIATPLRPGTLDSSRRFPRRDELCNCLLKKNL